MRTILSLTGLVSSSLGRRLANGSTPVTLPLTSTILSSTSSPALAASPPACTAVTWPLVRARAVVRVLWCGDRGCGCGEIGARGQSWGVDLVVVGQSEAETAVALVSHERER
eukprot:scaffold120550_cov45-Phaeocystis_antarctica.AAC.1